MSPLRIALYVSLGVNLFIVGWWVGDVWRRPPSMEPRPFNIAGMAQDRLDPATIESIGPILGAIDAVIRTGFDERIQTFGELREAVAADPYDPAAVDALLDRLVDERNVTEAAQWKLVGETLARLSAADRDALASVIFIRPQGPLPPSPGSIMPFGLLPR